MYRWSKRSRQAALRTLDLQERAVEQLRARTGTLLGTSCLIASVFGSEAIRHNENVGLAGALALTALVVSVGLCVYVLASKRDLTFGLDAIHAYEYLADVGDFENSPCLPSQAIWMMPGWPHSDPRQMQPRADIAGVSAATLGLMPTLLRDPLPGEVQELLRRRARLGQDHKDEVWEGVLHVVPAPEVRHARISQQLAEIVGPAARAAGLTPAIAEFNLGDSETDYRVPDGGLLHPDATGTWLHTAPLVVEILSPGDQTWEKLPFYAAHHVQEILIVDPDQQRIHWLTLAGGDYRPIQRSRLIELDAAELQAAIRWPGGAQG